MTILHRKFTEDKQFSVLTAHAPLHFHSGHDMKRLILLLLSLFEFTVKTIKRAKIASSSDRYAALLIQSVQYVLHAVVRVFAFENKQLIGF